MKKILSLTILLCLVSVSFISPVFAAAGNTDDRSAGQVIYVPAYSHIYSGNQARPFQLTVTLSIRNTDLTNPIKITKVNYYATQGKHLKKYVEKTLLLNPLGSARYIIPQRDESGGSGANFIVEWESDKLVNPPIVETVMIGTQSQQGVSFTSRGQALVPSKQ